MKVGLTHPDTFFCQDKQVASKFKGIQVWHDDKNIFGYQVLYEADRVGHHLGKELNPCARKEGFELTENEIVTRVTAYHSNVMHRLEFETSAGRVISFGGQAEPNYESKSFIFSENESLHSLKGGFGGHLHNLELII